MTNEDIIVVTGGERDGGPEGTLDSVELLFQFNQNFWTSGKGTSIYDGQKIGHHLCMFPNIIP